MTSWEVLVLHPSLFFPPPLPVVYCGTVSLENIIFCAEFRENNFGETAFGCRQQKRIFLPSELKKKSARFRLRTRKLCPFRENRFQIMLPVGPSCDRRQQKEAPGGLGALLHRNACPEPIVGGRA